MYIKQGIICEKNCKNKLKSDLLKQNLILDIRREISSRKRHERNFFLKINQNKNGLWGIVPGTHMPGFIKIPIAVVEIPLRPF
jgi:hypothetical protein